ncbi:hypothetical protein [Natronorubrum texcoconense]|uniref:Major facilitator superfamily (MFS) profile domain-containing protein n=1 Tax=Natronorubrum texcoconense TaxID=1095776 RepID=A0A1G8VM42_9EURY|nr:hypothetical protein [Natronorubrum texcoconense]SDJ67118.1 hypothetical protein SAMN04515672_1407 [Natronorubrum texcoconense]
MFESVALQSVLRNFSIYGVGVALAVVGALGLSEAIDLSTLIAAVCFAAGLLIVVAVHEYLGGPI